MTTTFLVRGLNLEKLLREASNAGIAVRAARRADADCIRIRIPSSDFAAFTAVCERFGWEVSVLHEDACTRLLAFLKRRRLLAAGLLAGIAMAGCSSWMILSIRIEGAGAYEAEIRRFLQEERIAPGMLRSAVSPDLLRDQLLFRLPGLVHARVSHEGSTLLIAVRPSGEGERTGVSGDGVDVVAEQPGIVTKIVALSGTPAVKPGETVCRGQVLIRGEERDQQGSVRTVRAEGSVLARVWARGDAQVSLNSIRTVETGLTRRRVTLRTPWSCRITHDAEPYASQDTSAAFQPVVGLYLPLWRQIEIFAETEVFPQARSAADAASVAQAAAEEIAKKQCPYHALILDKWVDYSMIDNEFVYATVVLEYEAPIAGRIR